MGTVPLRRSPAADFSFRRSGRFCRKEVFTQPGNGTHRRDGLLPPPSSRAELYRGLIGGGAVSDFEAVSCRVAASDVSVPLMPSLKPRNASPSPLPSPGSLLGPKISRQMTRMMSRCSGLKRLSNMKILQEKTAPDSEIPLLALLSHRTVLPMRNRSAHVRVRLCRPPQSVTTLISGGS